MASSYNKDQNKERLYRAIKMRDEVIERVNHKTGEVEKLKYSRKHIKDVNNLRAVEAKTLGIYPKNNAHIKSKQQRKLEATVNRNNATKRVSRRIKEQ